MDESNTKAGRWSLPTYTARSLCPSGDLCVTCDRIFNYMLYPTAFATQETTEDDLEFPLAGFLDRIVATKSCALCQFIAELARSLNLDLTSFHAQNRILCSIPESHTVETIPSSSRGLRAHWNFLLRFTRFEEVVIEGNDEGINQRMESDVGDAYFTLDRSCLQALRNYEEPHVDNEASVFHVGRKVPDNVDPAFLRKCYETCREHHGPECDDPRPSMRSMGAKQTADEQSLRSVRVIDTRTLKLVYLPNGADFVALSYTWSTMPFLSLLESTKEALFESINWDELPPTISDSIETVKAVGERYLWADRLCIIQDSPEDKAVQLTQMDNIYRRATLTIVAAASGQDGTDEGLPGIRKGTRNVQQATTTIRQNILLVQTRARILDEALARSRWNTRAWTYQEDLMSRRQLIFLPQQVVFSCRKEAFAEDYVRRACFHGLDEQAMTRIQDEQLPACCQYETPATTDDCDAGPILGSNNLYLYYIMVRDYTLRRMTVATDVLDAIDGLFRILTRASGENFLCGLPLTLLVVQWLVWRPLDHSDRRRRKAFGVEARESDPTFLPSWSWAGWTGNVAYDIFMESHNNFKTLSGHCEPLVEGGYTILVPRDHKAETTAEEEMLFSSSPIELRPQDLYSDPIPTTGLFDRSFLQHSRLQFSALAATVHLAPTYWGYNTDQAHYTLAHSASHSRQIFINSSFAGVIFPHIPSSTSLPDLRRSHQDFRLSLPAKYTLLEEVELIALSTVPAWPIGYPYNMDDEQAKENLWYVDAEGEEQDHVPFDPEVWKGVHEGGEVVNVLMIEWDDIGESRVARRTGVGQVHRDAWEMTEPKVKEIVLG